MVGNKIAMLKKISLKKLLMVGKEKNKHDRKRHERTRTTRRKKGEEKMFRKTGQWSFLTKKQNVTFQNIGGNVNIGVNFYTKK